MPPAKKKVTKKVHTSSYSNYTYAIWIIVGVTVGVLASKYLRNQNQLGNAATEVQPTKKYQDVPPPPPVQIDNSKILSELREQADSLSASLSSHFSETQFRKVMEIYSNILVKYSTAWDWWKVSDTQWLVQASWTPLKVAAAKIYLIHNQNVQQAYQIFDEVAQDPNTDPNHYNVAMDYLTQHLLNTRNTQEAIYWLKYAISNRKDDSTVSRWYTFLLSELVTSAQTDQAKKQATRCVKDFEKITVGFPFACYFELAMLTVFEGDYKQANRYFYQLYDGGLKDGYKNELNQICPSTQLVQLSLDSISSLERDALGRTLASGIKLLDRFKNHAQATCSTQKWPLYLTEELEEDPNPVTTKLSAQESEEVTRLRRVAKNQEGRTLGMRCYSSFQKLPIIYYLEDVIVQGPSKSILETFENRTGCTMVVPSYPYINSLAFPRYFGLNTYRYENLPVYEIEKAFITSFVDGNYYHLLLEVVPQILIFLKSPDYDPSVKFIMKKSRAADEIMRFLGLEDSVITYVHSSYRFHVKNAYVPDWYFTDSENALHAPHDTEEYYVPPLPVILGVREAIFSFTRTVPAQLQAQNLVIFIHRDDEAIRGIANSDRLYTYLEGIVVNFGYQLVVHGKSNTFPTVAKQAEQFSQAALVIGMHGAGLTNILFCSPGASVIELPVYPEKVSVYSRLSSALNLPYYTVPSFATYNFAKVDLLTEQMVYDLRDTVEYALSIHKSKFSQ